MFIDLIKRRSHINLSTLSLPYIDSQSHIDTNGD